MRNDRQWNWRECTFSGVLGGLQSATTFGVSFAGGRAGLFTNKLTNMSSSDFMLYVSDMTGKITNFQALVYSGQMLLSSGIARMLLTSGPAALIRMLIEKLGKFI